LTQSALKASRHRIEVGVDAAFFEKVYRGFKARPPRNYPLPEIPRDLRDKVEKMIDHADLPGI